MWVIVYLDFYSTGRISVIISPMQKNCNLQCVRSTTIELKTRFRNRKLSKKINKKSFEVAIDLNRIPHTIKLHFRCKDQKKKHNSWYRKIGPERLAYWGAQLFIHIPLGLNKRQEFNSRTVFTTLENRKVLNCRILAANLKPFFFYDVFILFLFFFLFSVIAVFSAVCLGA